MITTAVTQLEHVLMTQAVQQVGRRLGSAELGTLLLHMIGERARASDTSRMLPMLLRLAIKLSPYASYVQTLIGDHGTVMRAFATRSLPELMRTIEACRLLKVPVPIIASCEDHMFKARDAQNELTNRYFGIRPLVVRGDASALQERLVDGELCLPVDDGYDGLATKIFETFVLIQAIAPDCGLVKFDDDLRLLPAAPLNLRALQATFETAEYIGLAQTSPHHDRCWHAGKCRSPAPIAYGKPFRGPWAHGGVYYLSGRAVQAAGQHYLRFPGCLDGELYEDKAVGDILREAASILVEDHPLEPRFGMASAAPETHLVAAE